MTTSDTLVATPRRAARYGWLVIALIWATNILSFFDRQAMAFAAPFAARELGYRPATVGLIVGIVFASYTLMQIPGGRLADRFGQRRWVILGVAWWTVFSVLTGTVAESLTLLLIVRFTMGIGEGIVPPSTYRIIANWFTPGRRTFALGTMLTSAAIGPAIAPLVAAPIIATHGWRWIFYFSAIPGVAVVVLLLLFLRDSPHTWAARGSAEQTAGATPGPPEDDHPFDVRDLLSLRLAAVVLGIFFLFFALYGLNAWLPSYLANYRHLDLRRLAAFSSLPYVAGVVGMVIGARLCNGPLRHRRAPFVIAGTLLTTLCIVGVWTSVDAVVGEVFLVAALFFTYMIFGPVFSLPMDSVPTHGVGTYLGAVNMAPQIAGVTSPIIIGALVGPDSFAPAFLAMVVALLLSAACQAWVAYRNGVARRIARTAGPDAPRPQDDLPPAAQASLSVEP